MRLRFCGVRGSTPATGTQFVRVGGNTSCVAVTPDGARRPSVILDAGTGLRSVTSMLDGAAFAGTILLTHLHWDHVQGLPFFQGGDRDDSRVRVLLPENGADPRGSIEQIMSPPHFPIGPDGLRGEWSFAAIDEGERDVEGISVLTREVPHKGGRTFGYRLVDSHGSLAYVPDHRPAADGWGREAADTLAAGVDVLVHNAQFTPDEAELAAAYGHSTMDQAIDLARRAGVGRLLLFHHAPSRTDERISEIVESIHGDGVRIDIACEGDEIEIG